MASSRSARSRTRPPAGSGRTASTPAASCCCRPIRSPTTSSSTPRSSSSTPAPASTTTTSCTAPPRSSSCGSTSRSSTSSTGARPGIDLIPIGYINQHHEPTQFYSVHAARALQRPHPVDLEGAGDQRLRHDRRRLNYQVQASTSLEDFGERLRRPHRCQYRAAVPDAAMPPASTASTRSASRNPLRGDFSPALSNDSRCPGRLDYRAALPAGICRQRQRLLHAQHDAARRL